MTAAAWRALAVRWVLAPLARALGHRLLEAAAGAPPAPPRPASLTGSSHAVHAVRADAFLDALALHGGIVVSASDCTPMEIAFAQAAAAKGEARWYVSSSGLGFVRRPAGAGPADRKGD